MSNPLPLGQDLPAEAPPSSASLPAELPVDVTCPKCNAGRLIDPGEMGYCPTWGYCRYVEEARRDPGLAPPKAPTDQQLIVSGMRETLSGTPAWVGVLLAGVVVIIIYLIALDRMLANPSYQRA